MGFPDGNKKIIGKSNIAQRFLEPSEKLISPDDIKIPLGDNFENSLVFVFPTMQTVSKRNLSRRSLKYRQEN